MAERQARGVKEEAIGDGYVCDAVESEGKRGGWMDGPRPTYRESAPWSCIRVAVSRESIG